MKPAGEIIDGPKTKSTIPLHLKINEQTNNAITVKLELRCKLFSFETQAFFKNLPQSHLIRGHMDPMYYTQNRYSERIDFLAPNRTFQINIQDIEGLEKGFMLQQKKIDTVDVVSDLEIGFRFNDRASAKALRDNR